MKARFFALLLIPIVLSLTSSTTAITISENESLTFVASYNMAGTMTKMGEVKMTTARVTTKSKKEFLHLKFIASTYSSIDDFFKVRDLYESYINPTTLKPSLFNRSIEEGIYKKKVKYKFKWNESVVKTDIDKFDGYPSSNTTPIPSKVYDLVSAIYRVRKLDFRTKSPGYKAKLNVIVDGKIHQMLITYVGSSTKSVSGKGSVPCHELDLKIADGGLNKAQGKKRLWLTADNAQVPVLIEAHLPIGKVNLKLK